MGGRHLIDIIEKAATNGVPYLGVRGGAALGGELTLSNEKGLGLVPVTIERFD